MYDSTIDTKEHIAEVVRQCVEFTSNLRKISSKFNNAILSEINKFIIKLTCQVSKHDASKLVSPEKDGFDKYTPMLAKMAYGSDAYNKCKNELQHPYLDHHYASNRHHPEHFKNGILGMNLFDFVEMLCDWKAAVKRNLNGDIHESLKINRKRFEYDNRVYFTLLNTVDNNFEDFNLYRVICIYAEMRVADNALSKPNLEQKLGSSQLATIVINTLESKDE